MQDLICQADAEVRDVALPDIAELTEEDWREQKAVAHELRRLREAAGLTQAELAEKIGEGCDVSLIERYEDGGMSEMEIWPIFRMVKALRGNMNDLDPLRLLAGLYSANGYTDLSDDSRQIVDRIIDALLTQQRQTP